MSAWICVNCAGQYADSPRPSAVGAICAICADEREYVPPCGQGWTTLDQLVASGHRVEVGEVERHCMGCRCGRRWASASVRCWVRTSRGNLLWDAPGYLDPDGVERVRRLGGLAIIASSHPHLYGAQIEWSHAFGGVPVLVPEADRGWLMRPDPVVEFWTDAAEVLPASSPNSSRTLSIGCTTASAGSSPLTASRS